VNTRLVRRLAALLLGAAAGLVQAALIEVSPVIHRVPAERQATSMTVANRGDAPVTLQVRAFLWSQEGGQEQLVPATDVTFSPAIFTLAAGKSQVVRALLPALAAQRERTFRFLIDEIPSVDAIEPVRFALRLSIPLFWAAKTPQQPELRWRIEAGSGRVFATNDGGAHERVAELALRSEGGERLKVAGAGTPYVLAGATRSWAVADGRTLRVGERLVVEAQTGAGRIAMPVVVTP
jgi:fimbrial chaperone protein